MNRIGILLQKRMYNTQLCDVTSISRNLLVYRTHGNRQRISILQGNFLREKKKKNMGRLDAGQFLDMVHILEKKRVVRGQQIL